VFSRTMILEHVWDQSFEGVTNIVDVYVRYLRRKIDEPFPVQLIHTVRGVGYCIREDGQARDPGQQ
jgi:DNA-binding response OmpR family regulator